MKKLIKNTVLFGVLSMANGAQHPVLNVSSTVLDKIAEKYGTDKGPKGCPRVLPSGRKMDEHHYTRYYDFYFSHLRNKKIKILEIGFLYGDSARMWKEYFPQAELYFIDNDPKAFETYGKDLASSCHFYVLDQADRKALLDFAVKSEGDFDIIVDDGGHKMHQQINSFEVLFPFLKSGGIYVIEDMHSSYVKYYGGCGTRENPEAGEGTAMHFLFDLVHELNYYAARAGCADIAKCPKKIFGSLNYYQKSIETIHFYPSLGFVFKR